MHDRDLERQLEVVYQDGVDRDEYGFESEYADKIEEVWVPMMGRCFLVKSVNRLLTVAASLSRFSILEPADSLQAPLAVGWTTGLVTVLIKLTDLRRSIMRYDPDGGKDETGRPLMAADKKLVDLANLVASHEFRAAYGMNWPNMARKHGLSI